MRGRGAYLCSGCVCDTCANSVELLPWYMTIGEAVEPCFSCDECRQYDEEKSDQWRDSCPRHIEAQKVIEAREREKERRAQAADKRAQAIRATFEVIKGGGEQ